MQADVPPRLTRSLRVPSCWTGLGTEAQPLRLWVSCRGAVSPLHFDSAASFLAQARGAKRVLLFPPRSLPGLYPYPVDHPLHRRARVDLYAPRALRAARFPRFEAEAEPLAREVLLEEGDVLFLPPWWWHHVETTSDVSFSVGARYV